METEGHHDLVQIVAILGVVDRRLHRHPLDLPVGADPEGHRHGGAPQCLGGLAEWKGPTPPLRWPDHPTLTTSGTGSCTSSGPGSHATARTAPGTAPCAGT